MNEAHSTTHWRVEDDPRGVVLLTLDKADATANVLSGDVMRELSDCLDMLEAVLPKGWSSAPARPRVSSPVPI